MRSRLNPALVEFKSYGSDQIEQIVRQRAQLGLCSDALTDAVAKKLARLSAGDARVAIQALRHAAAQANVTNGKIAEDHVTVAQKLSLANRNKYVLAKMSEHHRLIYQLIEDEGEIHSGPLWTEYLSSCSRAQMRPAADRTFTLYLKQGGKPDQPSQGAWYKRQHQDLSGQAIEEQG